MLGCFASIECDDHLCSVCVWVSARKESLHLACTSGDFIGGSDLCVVCCYLPLFGLVGVSMDGEYSSTAMAMVVNGWRCLSADLADAVFAHFQTFHAKWRYIHIRYIRSYSGGNHANYDVAEMQKIH